jgi:hypothetical protein
LAEDRSGIAWRLVGVAAPGGRLQPYHGVGIAARVDRRIEQDLALDVEALGELRCIPAGIDKENRTVDAVASHRVHQRSKSGRIVRAGGSQGIEDVLGQQARAHAVVEAVAGKKEKRHIGAATAPAGPQVVAPSLGRGTHAAEQRLCAVPL